MSFSVDQFMQVKCKFQLTSESESSESIYTNNEQVRLCQSVNLDNNSTLIVMVCTNETSNNHVLAYYVERRQQPQQTSPSTTQALDDASLIYDHSLSIDNQSTKSPSSNVVTFAKLAAHSAQRPTRAAPFIKLDSNYSPRQRSSTNNNKLKTKPRVIVKQIYYHSYNEDIVAICLSQTGTKLVLINASSTIYLVPIKNILLNLHAQQLRSSQGRSMFFYDAKILSPCTQSQKWSFEEPVDLLYWESTKDTLIVANQDGKLIFLSVEERREICSTSVGEPIKSIDVLRDGLGHSLLITCTSLNQYRLVLEPLNDQPTAQSSISRNLFNDDKDDRESVPSVISLPQSKSSRRLASKYQASPPASNQNDNSPWASKPIPIKPVLFGSKSGAASAANAIQRVFIPTSSRFGGGQANLLSNFNDVRERPLTLLGHQLPNLISLIDVLGSHTTQNHSSQLRYSSNSSLHRSNLPAEPRLLRFYSNKHYNYQPQRPQIICKLDSLDPDELITNLIITDRFIAYTTDRDRCIINSRNCCKFKSSLSGSDSRTTEANPLIKEITFNHEEKIMLLVKSPVSNDPDNIIDSFLLITTRSIYSIEARHSCRDLFINLIDSHLAIKRTLFMSKSQLDEQLVPSGPHDIGHSIGLNDHSPSDLSRHVTKSRVYDGYGNAESNLLINNFLQHREVYEKICHDSQAFSTLFKLDLSSLYEAYADRLLQRGQLDLANRFFHMASFDHTKILGKYIRIGAYKETIEYVIDVMSDENDFRKILSENEKIEVSKVAFECLLAKTIVERSKVSLYKTKLNRERAVKLFTRFMKQPNLTVSNYKQPPDIYPSVPWTSYSNFEDLDPFNICEHSPRGQDAKLSATTIVPHGFDEEEETLTSNTETNSQIIPSAKLTRAAKSDEQSRLECEKALIDFIKNLMPSSMYEYTVDQLLDFDLIEFIDMIAHTDIQILSFFKMIIRYRGEDRLLFRAKKLDALIRRLDRLNQTDLIKINTNKQELLDFLTSPRVNRTLIKDISLTCDFYGYQHTLVQFRKFSFAALHQLETLRQLIKLTNSTATADAARIVNQTRKSMNQSITKHVESLMDDDANDGMSFRTMVKQEDEALKVCFNEQQKQTAENIFIEFLCASLDESADDSCRVWFNYINFYLNYVGDLQQLQVDILRMIETLSDCRLAVSLYKAIHRDEIFANASKNLRAVRESKFRPDNGKDGANEALDIKEKMTFWKENVIANTPLATMDELYSLADLFKNEFLMRLLEKTLDLLPQSAELDSISIATMC